MSPEDYTRIVYKNFYNHFEHKRDALKALQRALELLSDDCQDDNLMRVCLSNAAWHLELAIGNENESKNA